jgi:hypothetical protein
MVDPFSTFWALGRACILAMFIAISSKDANPVLERERARESRSALDHQAASDSAAAYWQ